MDTTRPTRSEIGEAAGHLLDALNQVRYGLQEGRLTEDQAQVRIQVIRDRAIKLHPSRARAVAVLVAD